MQYFMKKLMVLFLSVFVLLTSCASTLSGDTAPSDAVEKPVVIDKIALTIGSDALSVNGIHTSTKAPYTEGDEVFVPARAVAEAIGCDVGWDGAAGTVGISNRYTSISFVVGSNMVSVNGAEKELPFATALDAGVTMVPLRLISDAFDADTVHDLQTGKITIISRRIQNVPEYDRELLSNAKALILAKTKMLDESAGTRFPEGTKNGKYVANENPGWTAGFYPGLNYLCNDFEDNDDYLTSARASSAVIKKAFDNDEQAFVHDIGFVILNSYYKEYLKTGNKDARDMVIRGGNALVNRVKPAGYIQAWNPWRGSEENATRMIADTMCNLPLLYICSELTGDPKYASAAEKHAQITQQYIIRPDNTSAHTFIFYEDGSPKYQKTHQGYSDDSCWSRGQAWLVNGFAACYLASGDESFLESAKNCADVFLKMTDNDLVPRWDLVLAGNENEPRDTSAASILACGFLDLWKATGHEFYRDTAYSIFVTLLEKYAVAADEEGIISQAVASKPGSSYVNSSLIYGDYYFALLTQRLSSEYTS